MITIVLKLLIVLSGIAMYTAGELFNKNLKYLMGVPIAILGTMLTGFSTFTLFPLWCALTYFIACEIGYGDNNPLTKIVGKRAAITIHGTAVGLASYPLVGMWCILGGIISGVGFFFIAKWDDDGWFKEPFVAIGRGVVGTAILLIA